MLIGSHKNATTTAACGHPTVLGQRVRAGCPDGTSQTMGRWRKRDSVLDASPTPHRLQTPLNAAEVLVIDRRSQCRLSLDDICWRWGASSSNLA